LSPHPEGIRAGGFKLLRHRAEPASTQLRFPLLHTGFGERSLPPRINHSGRQRFPRGSAARTQNLPRPRNRADSLRKSPRDLLRVTVDGVEKPGEAEAQHRPQEEHPEHHLLLERSHEIHVGPQHGQDPQAEEQNETCRERSERAVRQTWQELGERIRRRAGRNPAPDILGTLGRTRGCPGRGLLAEAVVTAESGHGQVQGEEPLPVPAFQRKALRSFPVLALAERRQSHKPAPSPAPGPRCEDAPRSLLTHGAPGALGHLVTELPACTGRGRGTDPRREALVTQRTPSTAQGRSVHGDQAPLQPQGRQTLPVT